MWRSFSYLFVQDSHPLDPILCNRNSFHQLSLWKARKCNDSEKHNTKHMFSTDGDTVAILPSPFDFEQKSVFIGGVTLLKISFQHGTNQKEKLILFFPGYSVRYSVIRR